MISDPCGYLLLVFDTSKRFSMQDRAVFQVAGSRGANFSGFSPVEFFLFMSHNMQLVVR